MTVPYLDTVISFDDTLGAHCHPPAELGGRRRSGALNATAQRDTPKAVRTPCQPAAVPSDCVGRSRTSRFVERARPRGVFV